MTDGQHKVGFSHSQNNDDWSLVPTPGSDFLVSLFVSVGLFVHKEKENGLK